MKRLIQYTSPYEEFEFSDCSTKYEVLPYVVDDTAGVTELRELAKLLGFKPVEKVKTPKQGHRINITHSIAVGKTKRIDSWTNKLDTRRPIETTRLGFVTINEREADRCGLEVNVECEGIITSDQAQEILNHQAFDFQDFIELEEETLLLIDSWQAFHHLKLLGYSLKQFMSLYNCTETIFSDSVSSCSDCGAWMHNDNGYTYNYRIIDCGLLGVECGCYAEHMLKNWEDRINDAKTPIEKDVAESLEEQGKIEHLERFIGGMTDGRGGYYAGKRTREGDPEQVLAEYTEKYPDCQFIFTHDESGQFQTYFSIYKVLEV